MLTTAITVVPVCILLAEFTYLSKVVARLTVIRSNSPLDGPHYIESQTSKDKHNHHQDSNDTNPSTSGGRRVLEIGDFPWRRIAHRDRGRMLWCHRGLISQSLNKSWTG